MELKFKLSPPMTPLPPQPYQSTTSHNTHTNAHNARRVKRCQVSWVLDEPEDRRDRLVMPEESDVIPQHKHTQTQPQTHNRKENNKDRQTAQRHLDTQH